ncbi:hypothetical protein SETIT_5G047300v2 [Setaria italica]|uniref:Uncharacterized protein n=1 Tax=Setaria italica TaxID=4555 RepID=A0A368R1L4_SETIT|nr:hypothetical protein SETIT_5G047300v2 [Setaria italica]
MRPIFRKRKRERIQSAPGTRRRRRARDGHRPAVAARDLPRRWSRQAGARASSLLHRPHPPQRNRVLQALAAATVPVKMAAGLLLLLAASLGTRAGKQVYLCVSDGCFMVHASTGHGRMRAADCCCKAYSPYRTMAIGHWLSDKVYNSTLRSPTPKFRLAAD